MGGLSTGDIRSYTSVCARVCGGGGCVLLPPTYFLLSMH